MLTLLRSIRPHLGQSRNNAASYQPSFYANIMYYIFIYNNYNIFYYIRADFQKDRLLRLQTEGLYIVAQIQIYKIIHNILLNIYLKNEKVTNL